MATATINYSSNTTITMTLSNLASNSTLVAGRESNQIDNTTDKYIDAIVEGSISVGTTPSVNGSMAVFVWGSDTSLATAPINTLTGVDSAKTIDQLGILHSALKLAATATVSTSTNNLAYPISPFSVAQLFGGILPKYWGLYVAHNTGVNLRSDGVNNNSFSFVGIKYDVA